GASIAAPRARAANAHITLGALRSTILLDRPTSRLSKRITRWPRPASSAHSSSSQWIIWVPSPMMRRSGRSCGRPITSYAISIPLALAVGMAGALLHSLDARTMLPYRGIGSKPRAAVDAAARPRGPRLGRAGCAPALPAAAGPHAARRRAPRAGHSGLPGERLLHAAAARLPARPRLPCARLAPGQERGPEPGRPRGPRGAAP